MRGFDEEPPYRYLRYQVVRVWELQAEALATGGWGTFPLAPLCEDAKGMMPGLIRRMGQRVKNELPDPAQARELWTLTELLLGLRYQDPLLKILMQEIKNMVDLTESLSYQRIVAEGLAVGKAEGLAVGKAEGLAVGKAEGLAVGKAEGLAVGKAEGLAVGKAVGKAEGLRDILLRLGTKKFGKPSAKYLRELNRITDQRRLTDLGERLLDVDSWKELLSESDGKS